MKKIQALVVSAVLAIGMAAPASAATSDPEVIIYRFPGVLDSGGADNTGAATTFHCTNFSGSIELFRFVTRRGDTTIASNITVMAAHLESFTRSTKLTNAYGEFSLSTGMLPGQGTTAIAATSINVVCTAMTIDASTVVPVGVAFLLDVD